MSTLANVMSFGVVRPNQPSGSHYQGGFAALACSASQELYRVALRRTRNAADAQEASQEALLKALTHLHQFVSSSESHNPFQAWLRRIAENESIDILRRRRADRVFSLDAPAGEEQQSFAARLVSLAENPEQQYERRQTRGRLADAIERLRPDLRSVILLRDVLQYSTAETARRLAISNTAVRLRLFRARRRLRESLREQTLAVGQRPVPARRAHQSCAPVFAPACTLSSFACGD